MRSQHALLSMLPLLPLLLFFSVGVYAQADRDPRRDIHVEFGLKYEGNDAGYVLGTVMNRSANAYPCVRIEFDLFTRPDLRPRGQEARHLGVVAVQVEDLQPRVPQDYQQRLPYPAGVGLRSVSECKVRPTGTAPTTVLGPGVYTIRQKSNGRYVDAYIDKNDFALMTRPARDYVPKIGHLFFDPPTWVLTPVAGGYTIQQKRSDRFVDAHEIAEKDFAIVTRPEQNNDTQKWILTALGDNTFTIQQKSSGRFVDAHEIAGKDFRLVTRPAQNDETQQWIIEEFVPEG